MIRHAAEHAERVEEYIGRYGFEKVERMMDIGFALDGHINWNKGLYRKPYPSKSIRKRMRKIGEFDDLIGKGKAPSVIKEMVNGKFPPSPEKDLLWFFINYAPLEDWERDILDLTREESYYFHPQMMSKIVHEGFASYWHAEIMYHYDGLSAAEYLDFVRTHEKVVQPGANPFRINPYYLGFMIFKDIEKRWDKLEGKGAGKKKIFQVVQEENDISFIQNYLTADLIADLKLFTFGYAEDYPKDHLGDKFIEIKEKIREEVVETIVKPMYNGGVPKIVITGVGQEGALLLQHDSEEYGTLDFRFAEKTLEYIWDLWAAPVELHARDDDDKEQRLCFDEAGFYTRSIDDEDEDDGGAEDDEKDEGKYFKLIIP
jgi:stage V sporulation protein R